jgi:hypothetical protein
LKPPNPPSDNHTPLPPPDSAPEPEATSRPSSRPWEAGVRISLDAWDVVHGEAVRAWKILLRLLKGSQLMQERRKILLELGALAAERLRDGRWTEPEDTPRVQALLDQLDRLDRKLRLEERLIAQLRARGPSRGPAPARPTPEEERYR